MAVGGATRDVTPNLEEKQYLRQLLEGPQPPGLDTLREALDNEPRNTSGES